MTTQDRIDDLQKQKSALLLEQAGLIKELKIKHLEVYNWFLENGIDPTNLAKYGANIASALVFTLKPNGQFEIKWADKSALKPELTPIVRIIKVEELRSLKEDEKAELVQKRYGPIIKRVAEKYKVDPKLIFATIMLESGGNTYAVRQEPRINDASYGLGQILYGTARGLGFEGTPEKLFDPEVNIELIGKYHRRNMDVYGQNLTPQQLTTAYNAGSPYSTPYPGHLTKFQKWFDRVGNLLI
jgi:soluble lytic murein transglycosylase-like protein